MDDEDIAEEELQLKMKLLSPALCSFPVNIHGLSNDAVYVHCAYSGIPIGWRFVKTTCMHLCFGKHSHIQSCFGKRCMYARSDPCSAEKSSEALSFMHTA